MEASNVYPEIRCQGSSAPGITANYTCKDEAMHSIFNHTVDCNIKQVLNNVHMCTSVVVNMCQNAIPKATFIFFICSNSPNRVCLKKKRKLPNIYKENVESCESLCSHAPPPGLCIPVGFSLLPHSGGLQKPRATGFKQAPDPMWAPTRKIGTYWFCTSSASLTVLNPVKNMSHWWNWLSGEQKHGRVQRWLVV